MRMSLALCAAMFGCADDEPFADPYRCASAGGQSCFELPTKPIAAVDPAGMPVEPLLLCDPYQAATSAAPVTLSGKTVNPTNGATVPDVRVELFSDVALAVPIADVMSNETGDYALTVDAMPNLVFARTTADGFVPQLFAYRRIDLAIAMHENVTLQTLTRQNMQATLERVGDTFRSGKSLLAGVALDCNRNALVNVVANIAPASGRGGIRYFEPDVRTYYATATNATELARRTELMQTTASGGFAASNVASGTHYVQLWGFLSEATIPMGSAALKLVGEVEIVVPNGEHGVTVSVDARL